jgi:hypothetical protein
MADEDVDVRFFASTEARVELDTNTVKRELTAMCETTKTTMLECADQVFDSMRRDYMTLIGVEVEEGCGIPREEHAVREEVADVIAAIEL